jgi:hypothetical protein
MMRKCIVAFALLALAAGSAATGGSPNEVIESSVALLAEKLDGRREELTEDRKALYDIIDDILMPRFDRRFAAQVVLAKHWRTATAEQQSRFIEAFYRALLRKYADGILEFDPDMITVLPYRGDDTKKRTKRSEPRCAAPSRSMTAARSPWITNWSSVKPAGSSSMLSLKVYHTCAIFAPSSIRKFGRQAWTRS